MQPDELQQLERFLGCTINSLFQPPDLSDVNRQKAEFYMDVLEELWLSQALKERHFDAWHGALKREQQKEVRCGIVLILLFSFFITVILPVILARNIAGTIVHDVYARCGLSGKDISYFYRWIDL